MARRRTYVAMVPLEQRRPRNWAAILSVACGVGLTFVALQWLTFLLALFFGVIFGGVIYSVTTRRKPRRPY
jgi:4-hydroxybenzoate polyprenyltransferase